MSVTMRRLDRNTDKAESDQSNLDANRPRITSDRLARECDKLNVAEERRLAEEGLADILTTWPIY